METMVITNKVLIKKLTGKDDINEMRLHLDHKCCQVHYESDHTGFEISHWLPYYYKIKNILKES